MSKRCRTVKVDVANYLGLSQQSYSRYENGANELPLRFMEPLSKLYGVSSDYILGISANAHDIASVSENFYDGVLLGNLMEKISLLDKKRIAKLFDYVKYLIYEMNEEQK